MFLQLIAQQVDLLSLLPLKSGDIKIALPNGNSLLPSSWYRGPDQRYCRHYRHRRHHGNWRYCRAGLWHKQILYKLENLSHEDSHLPSNGVEQTHRFTTLRWLARLLLQVLLRLLVLMMLRMPNHEALSRQKGAAYPNGQGALRRWRRGTR